MPLQATSGAASYDGFGGGVPFIPTYIEDVFSTWLYTGNGSTQTITNGIDLSTKGGLVWIKRRNSANSHFLFDTARGVNNFIQSDTTAAAQTSPGINLSFNSNGWSQNNNFNELNLSGSTYASWTFRKQPKFFDVVTWSGNNIAGRQIPHSLGSVPGCIIVKNITSGTNWQVYHRSLGNTKFLELNTTAAEAVAPRWNDTTPTSTVFTVGSGPQVNSSPNDYVAYLFAHDAGGFGLTGTDNVISCGSFTTDGSGNATVSLGYEPQWVLIKQTDGVDSWYLNDNMRGMAVSGNQPNLSPNSSAAESAGGYNTYPNATGFTASVGIASKNYIYIAIRRGPMKTPTTGTSVYENTAYTGNGASNRQIGSSVLTDLLMLNNRDATAQSWSTYAQMFFDRLRGDDVSLATASTNAESTSWGSYMDFDMNAGWDTGPTTGQIYLNKTSSTYVSHIFRRAPGFFDVVCYTGNATVGRTVAHNLGVAPELLIVKNRAMADYNWKVYSSALGNTSELCLDLSNGTFTGVSTWNSTTPTSTQFTLSNTSDVNRNATNYVAYLFASCPGVSKVGSYTGDGTVDRVIDCGFTGGARFILLKKTSTTSGWYVYDTARGISSSGEASLLLNSTAAESGVADVIDPASVGFSVGTSGSDFFNESGVSYIFLAIA